MLISHHGLLYVGKVAEGNQLSCMAADVEARKAGLIHAEQLVRKLTYEQQTAQLELEERLRVLLERIGDDYSVTFCRVSSQWVIWYHPDDTTVAGGATLAAMLEDCTL